MKDRSTILEERAQVFELCANIFAREPNQEFLKLIHEAENLEIFTSCGIDPLSDMESLALDEQVEELAVEYTRLFLSPSNLAPPYESVQRGEGKLWGKCTSEVNKLYQTFGFKIDESYTDMPDHISVELSFIAQLLRLERKYTKKGLKKPLNGVLQVKKHFLKNHFLKLYPKFVDEIKEHANFLYYREIARFLGMLIEEEWQSLGSVEDIDNQKSGDCS